MKKIWKSYGVFTPTAYKISGLAVTPCIIPGLIELFVYANLFSAGHFRHFIFCLCCLV